MSHPLIKYEELDRDNPKLQENFGFLPYGDEEGLQVAVWVSSKMLDAPLWTYLMSVGGAAFFGTEYIVVRAVNLKILVKNVKRKLRSNTPYLLHGVPTMQDDIYCQILVEWDKATAVARGRQLLGTYMAENIEAHFKVQEAKEQQEQQEQLKLEEAKKENSMYNRATKMLPSFSGQQKTETEKAWSNENKRDAYFLGLQTLDLALS
jgi:hypothetical protein